ncbi:hypothetical protein O3P69_001832 [Scylla paramamosain]|uniref:Lipase domain-containing protein n=1 Tax=Scylla paramamosain TaxID=85552 RepID=A0AAW0V107_SCYPA
MSLFRLLAALQVVVVVVVVVAAAAAASAFRSSADDVHFLLWTSCASSSPGVIQAMTSTTAWCSETPPAWPPPLSTPRTPRWWWFTAFTSNGFTSWPVRAKTELLSRGSYNVISVDWEHLAESPWYPQAVLHTQLVGERTARLLEWLQEAAGLDVTQVQATGHSLGSHVCGAIGQHLEKFRLPFITGMDPAGPFFYNVTEEHRLDPSDAEFVQVIHTDACSILTVSKILKAGRNEGKGEARGCNHDVAQDYWLESINGETPFLAHPCQDWDAFQAGLCDTCGKGCLQMGFHVEKNLTGTYYLRTSGASPYAMG